MKNMPAWLQALLLKVLKDYVPASAVAELFDIWKAYFFSYLDELVAKTENKIDDAIAAQVKALFNSCTPDNQFLCDLIEKGEDAAIEFLRGAAAKTPNLIDDAVVDIIAEALKK